MRGARLGRNGGIEESRLRRQVWLQSDPVAALEMTDLGTLGGTGAEADGQGFEPPQSEESWFDLIASNILPFPLWPHTASSRTVAEYVTELGHSGRPARTPQCPATISLRVRPIAGRGAR